MKLLILSSLGVALVAITACATSQPISIVSGGPDGGATDNGAAINEDEDPASEPPHALGTITLGESHGIGASSTSTPIVTATFVPDALATKACTKPLAGGCEIAAAPKCTKTTTTGTGCLTNEVCSLDDTCAAVCKPAVTCTTTCAADEVCTASSILSATGSCVKIQSFDAGPIAFSGTTTTITLFPPYHFETTGQGAPFLGGSQLRVQAQGALEAGFDAFDETFTSTTFVQTNPSLAEIPRATIYGSGTIPVGWAPSTAGTTDAVIITVSGAGGTATCKVKDADAQFEIPRSVVAAAQGAAATASAPVSLSVTRQRREVHKDKHAKGELATGTVQPDGWLALVTQSTESASYQGCTTASQQLCNDTCTDVSYDPKNCGACGNACTTGQTCSSGTCTGGSTTTCSTCRSNALSGSCASYYSTCTANTDCYNLATCERSCTTASCVSSCESSYPYGVSAIASLKSCWTSYCSSYCGF